MKNPYDPEKVSDTIRRKLNARKKDQLFCSEEAVAYDRGVVNEFDKVAQEPPARDVEADVMPNVPTSEGEYAFTSPPFKKPFSRS